MALDETMDEAQEQDNLINAINVTLSNTQIWADENMTNFMDQVNDEYSDVINGIISKTDYGLIIRAKSGLDSHSI